MVCQIRGKLVLKSLLALVFSVGFSTPIWANCGTPAPTDPMRFLVMTDGSDHWIAAEGRIEADTAEVFREFLTQLDAPVQEITLNSIGGRLAGGLALGRSIRESGLATRVGDSRGCNGTEGRVGVCASACAYAFLGGVRREVGPHGHLGFHGIYPAAGQADIPEETLLAATDRAMETLRAYVLDMGANPILPEIAAVVPADRLYLPQGRALSALGIETDARPIDLALDMERRGNGVPRGL